MTSANLEPSHRQAGGPALDQAALARLRELDPDGRNGVVARVLSTYETALKKQLGQLAEMGSTPDAAAVSALAHTLKSSSASVGALSLAQVCEELERRIRTTGKAGAQDVALLTTEGAAALVAVSAALAR